MSQNTASQKQRVHFLSSEVEKYIVGLQLPPDEHWELRRERFAHAIRVNASPRKDLCSPDRTALKMRANILIPGRSYLSSLGSFGGEAETRDLLYEICSGSCPAAKLMISCRKVSRYFDAHLATLAVRLERMMDEACEGMIDATDGEKVVFQGFLDVAFAMLENSRASNTPRHLMNARSNFLNQLQLMESWFYGKWNVFTYLRIRFNDPALAFTRIARWYLECIQVPLVAYQATRTARGTNANVEALPATHSERVLLATG